MTITSADQFERGIEADFSRITVSKASITASAANGEYFSLWRGTGYPAQGAIPTTAGLTNTLATTGAIPFRNQTGAKKAYIAELSLVTNTTVPNLTVEIHDRLMSNGGFSGTAGIAPTPQVVSNFDLSTFLFSNNLDARKGDANYSDVQWWIEWYTDTGSTLPTTTINVTYNDGTTGNLTTFTFGRRAGRMLPLNPLIPAADSGKYIRGINSYQLSSTTGTAGSFGFTATRYRCSVRNNELSVFNSNDWTNLGLPVVETDACLFPVALAAINMGTIGTISLDGKIIYG